MERRELLAVTGGLGAVIVSGCLDALDETTSADPSADSSNGDPNGDESDGEEEPAELTIQDVGYDETVPYDATIEVVAEIENGGDVLGAGSVTFVFDGSQVEEKTVEIAGGESTEAAFQLEAGEFTGGEYAFDVETDDDSFGSALEIAPDPTPASFEIEEVTYASEVDHDESFDVLAVVANAGDLAGETSVSLSVGGETVDERSVDLEGGESTEVGFAVDEEYVFDGEYDLTVDAEDEEYDGQVFVDNPNPWGKATVEVGLQQEVSASHDIHDIVKEALEYWNENSEVYADYPLSYEFRPNADDPDILVRLVDIIEECGDHGGEYVMGCAPLLTDFAPDTAEILIADGYRPEWTVTTVKHEFGHTLGLDHDDEPLDIMSDDPYDRIPDYQDRIDAIDAYAYALEGRTIGTDYWIRGRDAYDVGDWATAQMQFDNAYQEWTVSGDLIDQALNIADSLDETEAVEILEEARTHFEMLAGAAANAFAAAQARNEGNHEDAEVYETYVNDYLDEAENYDVADLTEVGLAFGMPYRE